MSRRSSKQRRAARVRALDVAWMVWSHDPRRAPYPFGLYVKPVLRHQCDLVRDGINPRFLKLPSEIP